MPGHVPLIFAVGAAVVGTATAVAIHKRHQRNRVAVNSGSGEDYDPFAQFADEFMDNVDIMGEIIREKREETLEFLERKLFEVAQNLKNRREKVHPVMREVEMNGLYDNPIQHDAQFNGSQSNYEERDRDGILRKRNNGLHEVSSDVATLSGLQIDEFADDGVDQLYTPSALFSSQSTLKNSQSLKEKKLRDQNETIGSNTESDLGESSYFDVSNNPFDTDSEYIGLNKFGSNSGYVSPSSSGWSTPSTNDLD